MMEPQLKVNVLMMAHHFTLELAPKSYEHRISPVPSIKPSRKLEFRIAGRVCGVPV